MLALVLFATIQSYVGEISDTDNVLSRHALDSGANWNKSNTPELESDESRSRFALLRQAICGEPFAGKRQAIRSAANCFYCWLKFTSVRSVVNLTPRLSSRTHRNKLLILRPEYFAASQIVFLFARGIVFLFFLFFFSKILSHLRSFPRGICNAKHEEKCC